MVDKTRNPRREGGEENRRPNRANTAGRPGPRPGAHAQGRGAGKPATGPAHSRTVAGVDRRAMEMLEKEGLLTEEGRRALGAAGGPARKGAPRFPGAREERPDRGDRPERGARPERGDRPERGERFERGERPDRAARPGARPGLSMRKPPGPGQRPARPMGARKLNAAEATVAERLHKVMSRAGVASRRHSEELIQAGRVTVNGKPVTELGTKVVPGVDVVEVDGRPLGKPEDFIYILLNKPKGYVTTLYDPQGREKVTDLLGDEIAQRVYPVGRLDYDTEGLLLLTNDGDLANALMHPARQVKKTYIAKVRGVPGPAKLRALEEGIELDDGPTAPAEVKLVGAQGPNAATVSIRIHEGRNRQVRRMFEAVGHEVIHLKRTTLGPLNIKDLPLGKWRELTEREVEDLKASVGMRLPRAAKVAAITEKKRAIIRRGAARADRPNAADKRPRR